MSPACDRHPEPTCPDDEGRSSQRACDLRSARHRPRWRLPLNVRQPPRHRVLEISREVQLANLLSIARDRRQAGHRDPFARPMLVVRRFGSVGVRPVAWVTSGSQPRRSGIVLGTRIAAPGELGPERSGSPQRDADAAIEDFSNISHLMEPIMATASVTGEVLERRTRR